MAKEIFAKDPVKYIPALAEALKKLDSFKAPEWIYFVKSGTSKKRPPVDSNFWHIRSASILRQLYIKGVLGVGKLRTRYGSRKDRGTMPGEFRKASGKIIRLILQQAEQEGLVEKIKTNNQFGRRLTKKGREFLDSINVEETKGLDYDSYVIELVSGKEEYSEDEEENFEEVNEDEEED